VSAFATSARGASNSGGTSPESPFGFVARQIKFPLLRPRNSPHAEAILVHEALHSLGLGENPPSSDYITKRIRALCE